MEECSNILRTFLYHRSLGSNMLLSGKIRDSYNKTKSLKSRDRLSLKGANCQAHGPGLDLANLVTNSVKQSLGFGFLDTSRGRN